MNVVGQDGLEAIQAQARKEGMRVFAYMNIEFGALHTRVTSRGVFVGWYAESSEGRDERLAFWRRVS